MRWGEAAKSIMKDNAFGPSPGHHIWVEKDKDEWIRQGDSRIYQTMGETIMDRKRIGGEWWMREGEKQQHNRQEKKNEHYKLWT